MDVSFINSTHYRFAIFSAPNNKNIENYVNCIKNTDCNGRLKRKSLEKLDGRTHCRVWVRACDSTELYSDEILINNDILLFNLYFADGTVPSSNILKQWYNILELHTNETIAVHCIAGLGRAPLLVAIAMIEDGINPLEAIREIRRVRPGALNIQQVRFLQKYKTRSHAKKCLLL